MSSPIIKSNVTLANSEMLKIADRVANTMILAAEKVSADSKFKPISGSFESIFQKRLNAFTEQKRTAIQKKVEPFFNANEDIRISLLGNLGKVNVKNMESAEREVDGLESLKADLKLLGVKLPLNRDGKLSNVSFDNFTSGDAIFSSHNRRTPAAITGGAPVLRGVGDTIEGLSELDFEPQSTSDKLGLFIRRVKCIDETNPEWTGSDEIALAGISVDEDGDTKKIRERLVGRGFDDGDTKWYSPNWRWHWFSLREYGNNWPKTYHLTFMLAEKDNGGLSGFLQNLWDKAKMQIKKAIDAAVKAALKAAGAAADAFLGTGNLISSLLGPIGDLIGSALNYILDKVVGWLIRIWQDDIFKPKTISCTVPSYNSHWNRSGKNYHTSSLRRSHFYGHGGHYYIEYYWKLFS